MSINEYWGYAPIDEECIDCKGKEDLIMNEDGEYICIECLFMKECEGVQ